MQRTGFRGPGGFASILLAVLSLPLWASASQNFVGQTVTSISYEPARQPIDPRDLKNMQLVQIGEPLDLNQVAGTIDRFFSSGLYDDVEVDAEASAGGVALRFITQPRRFIGHVEAEGQISNPPSRNVLISSAQLQLGRPYDSEAVEAARKSIEQLMRDNGLYQAQVGVATVEDSATHNVTVRFDVQAGKRARYEMPTIQGHPGLSNATIVRATGWRVPFINHWRRVTQSLTDKGVDGIQKKYAKQDRLTASVNLTSLDYNPDTVRLKPTLDIEPGPKIEIRALEAKVSKKKLQQYIPVQQEASVDNDLLTEGARNLRDYFQAKGYPDVDVTFKREPLLDGVQTINYYIATGPRRRLVHIGFTGNNYFPESTLRERMFLQTNSIVLRYGRYSESFRESDEQTIANLYKANGFRDAKVSSTVQTDYRGKPKDIAVTFHINAGKQWTVAKLTITGTAQLDLNRIRNEFYSTAGQPYAQVNVVSDRDRILEYYYSEGFTRATFSALTRPGAEPATVDLTYRIREGPREFVRGVILSGLKRTRPSMVERVIDIQEGDPISMPKIHDIVRNLNNLGVFNNVSTALQDPDGTNRYKYVLYDFDEAARYTINLGYGLIVGQFGGTTNNLSAAGGVRGASPLFSIDVRRLNFLGRGQTLTASVNYSTIEQRESLSYTVPRFLGSANRTVTFSALYSSFQDVQTFSSKREEVSAQTAQRFNRASTMLFSFAYRRVSTGNVVISPLLVPQLLQPVRIGIFSVSYIQDHRDNPADAHRGFWNTLDTGIAGNFFGSQRNFFRTLGRNATYTPIGHNLVLARQTQVGVIWPFNIPSGLSHYDAIPLPERFYGGGSLSMRGFGDNQAGPRDIGSQSEIPGTGTKTPTGFPIGGNALFFNNVELRFPLLGPDIRGVFFEDMGNIYQTFSDISFAYHQPSNQNFNYAVQAAGFGIRYKTPLGPVRVDLAYALNPTQYLGFSQSLTIQQLVACSAAGTCTASPQRLSHFQFFFSIGQAF